MISFARPNLRRERYKPVCVYSIDCDGSLDRRPRLQLLMVWRIRRIEKSINYLFSIGSHSPILTAGTIIFPSKNKGFLNGAYQRNRTDARMNPRFLFRSRQSEPAMQKSALLAAAKVLQQADKSSCFFGVTHTCPVSPYPDPRGIAGLSFF
jgi:hypothetical protein